MKEDYQRGHVSKDIRMRVSKPAGYGGRMGAKRPVWLEWKELGARGAGGDRSGRGSLERGTLLRDLQTFTLCEMGSPCQGKSIRGL